jgi:hypothetical protein
MPGSAVGNRVERKLTLNAICLKKAVLCVDCDVVSDSPHDYCLVCGSRSLFNVGRLLGGLPKERAKVIEAQAPAPSIRTSVLTFPISSRAPLRRHRSRLNRQSSQR